MQHYHSFYTIDKRGGLMPIRLQKAPPLFSMIAMILRPKSFDRHLGMPAGPPVAAPLTSLPGWLRRAVPDTQSLGSQAVEDVAIAAGAAIGALDATVRRQERCAGAWRQRLALAAASASARQAGRVEDEGALRDAVLLTRAGDDVGPAGKMLLAWRRLATGPTEELLTEASMARILEEFGCARNDEAASELADDLGRLSAGEGLAGSLVGAFAIAERRGLGHAVGCWLADALLAQRLGWAHAVPILGGEVASGFSAARPRRAALAIAPTNVGADPGRKKSLLAAQARAALRAIDLSLDLERRAGRLLAVAPRLRARGAAIVVDRLLADDAILGSARIPGMSPRSLRRLFDRLVELDAAREISGRTTFRIYGI